MIRRLIIVIAVLPLLSGATPYCTADGAVGVRNAAEETWCCCGGCCGWSTDCRTIPGCETC